ncbi:MAG: KipI antagonist [Acidobacteria bacterium]|nr:MAG: KipI antagonist [Acidobacteriota bacterium]
MSLLIRKPGILSTVQDLGRSGGRSFGINPSGVMDPAAARIVNTLLENDDSTALIETHFPAAEIEFDSPTVFAIGGADFAAELDAKQLANWSTALADKGSVLRFRNKSNGARAYIGVRGGFTLENWLESASTNLTAGLGGFSGRALKTGDVIECGPTGEYSPHTAGPSIVPLYNRFPALRAIAAPEFELLTATSEQEFRKQGFTLTSECDRMGFRLQGKPLHLLHRREMISAGVNFGTIQLLPDGQLIVLMADHQTSGGYPRIANVISVDLPLLAQCGPGDGVSFQIVTTEEAERLAMRFERELNFLRLGCRLQRLNAKH